MNQYELLNELLVRLFNRIIDIEQKELITDEFSDITTNDIHIIEAIGLHEKSNMSTIAKSLYVTIGTLTIAINNLVKKGYVVRNRSTKDRRVVLLKLTKKGKLAFEHHKKFHENMINGIMEYVPPEQLNTLIQALSGLVTFFNEK